VSDNAVLAAAPPRRLLNRKQLEAKLSIRKDAILRAIRAGHLPEPIRFGPRVNLWVEAEVDAALDRAPRGIRTDDAEHLSKIRALPRTTGATKKLQA
jgi:predicted DNA-binding transcriptional regulator AlpA